MNGHLASIAALASLWLALIALVALVTRILWPWVARASRGWDPEDRARVAFLAAVAPVLVPSAVVVLCALPGIAGLLTGAGDHCIGHGDHPHFCPVHATLAMTPLLGVAFAGFTALAITLSVRTALALRAIVREQRWLVRRRAEDLAPGIHLLTDETPLALTHGLRSPGIWISQSLVTALSEVELEVVISHERAHATRRDPARLLAASIASTLHLPRIRAALLCELRVRSEQACDVRAADEIGNRLQVASALLRVERLMGHASCPVTFATSVVDSNLPARIEALLWPQAPPRDRRVVRQAAWILATVPLLLASPVHHLAEHVLEALLRSMVGLHLLS